MSETTATPQKTPARANTIRSLADHWADVRPGAPALGPLDYGALRNAYSREQKTGVVTTVDAGDPLVVLPRTLAGLADSAVVFSTRARVEKASPGELLFPALRKDGQKDLLRLPQDRLIAMAQALAKRYGFSQNDRLYVSGPFDDPGTWLALVAAIYSGTYISLDPEDASIVWILDGEIAPVDARTRILHLRAKPDTLSDVRRRHPEVTLVNGLALPEGGGLPICSDPRDPARTVSTTLGRPLGGMEVMIVDPRTGMDMLLYETGEVWLRGRGLMAGYASGSNAFEAARFLPTGLFGYLDSEGRLVLSGKEANPKASSAARTV